MPSFWKIVIGVVTFLGAAFIVLSFFSMRLIKKSLPQTNGEAKLAALQQEVTITRDAYSVPHIVAQNENDLWRAAGYVAAQDRLWQMEFSRRAVRGTLSEIFGPAVIEQDKFLRVWGFYRLAQQLTTALTPQSRAMLTAYAEGVNEYITTHSDRLPLEFSMLGFKPEPWEIEDSIGLARLMAFRLCHAWFFEAALGKVAEQHGMPMALEIFPAVLPNTPMILSEIPPLRGARGVSPAHAEFANVDHTPRPPLKGGIDEVTPPLRGARGVSLAHAELAQLRKSARINNTPLTPLKGGIDQTTSSQAKRPAPLSSTLSSQFEAFINLAQHTRAELGMPPGVLGSNNWVVHGSRTRSGKPMLANDPHLGFALPTVWYEMHLKAGEFEVMGQTLPGVPSVVLGSNRHIAWGFTNGMVDDLDFYQERVNGKEYLSNTGWKPLTIISEQIRIKGADPQTLEIRFTERGPLVNDILDVARSDSFALAIRWSGFEMSDELAAFYGMNRARSWSEFEAALQQYTVPAQNVVYADIAGNIGYRLSGRVPIRRDGKGFLPYRGWENNGDWLGVIPFEDMPHTFNPAQGFVATANNLIIAPTYKYYLSNSWEPSSRVERITEMLHNNAQVDTSYFKTMQLDQLSKHAQYTLPRLLRLMEIDTSLAPSDTVLSVQEKQALGLLRQWDYVESAESVAATLYNVWTTELLQATLRDEMGDTLFKNYVQWSSLAIRALEYLVDHPHSPWFDDRTTEAVENGRHIVRRGLRSSLQRLQEKFGELMGDWQWGQLHQLTLEHPFGKQKPLDVLFNVGPLPLGGSPSTVNKGEYNLAEPYAVNSGASMRRIVDMANPEMCLSILPGGQSGQPLSPHYKDQIGLWWKGQYRQVWMSAPRANASSQEVLRLQP